MSRLNSVKAGCAVALSGALLGCGPGVVTHSIEHGVVSKIEPSSEPQYENQYSCMPTTDAKGNASLDCSINTVYVGEEPTLTVTVVGCKRDEQGDLIIADDQYLHEHVETPSDRKLYGGTMTKQVGKRTVQTVCSASFEFYRPAGKKFKLGQLVTIAQMDEASI